MVLLENEFASQKLNLDIFAYAVEAELSHRFKHHPPPS